MDVDLPRLLDHRRADALVEDARPPRPSRGADHQLGGVHLAGEIQQGAWHVVADHGVHGGTEADGQLAHLAHLRCGDARKPVAANDMHNHQFGAGLRRDAGCPAHQGFRLRTTGDRDDDAFARLPGVGDLVVGAILVERGVDLVGEPEQRNFAQRGEVPAPEVIGQRRVDSLGRIHIAVGEPAPQRLWCDVDQLDLVGGADDLVGHLLLLLDAGDLGDDVVEALQVLDVDRGDHGDAGVEKLLDVLPAFGVLAARGVGVGELVDQHHLRVAAQHRLDVELGEAGCRGIRCSWAGRSRCRRADRRSSCGRASRRPRRPRRCRVPAGGAPRRAWRRSCRRRELRRDRCAAPRASSCSPADERRSTSLDARTGAADRCLALSATGSSASDGPGASG